MSVEFSKQELKAIVRRRKGLLLTSFLLIFLTGVIVAVSLPPVYQSTVMIIVENQEIPEDYVKSTVTSYVSERLEMMRRKILSHGKLLKIIREHDLYPDLSQNSEMVQEMRKDILLETIDVSLSDRKSRFNASATIAFNLSYAHRDPKKAKEITNILANLFLEEDQRTREMQAVTTTSFIEKELEDLRRQVQINEEKISQFKAANIDQLPGSTTVFTQTIFRLEQDLDNIEAKLQTTQDKIVYLKSQIANIDPMVPILTETGKVANNPNNRLKYLRLQLLSMQSNLSDKHPDIIKLKSEISELEAQVGETDSSVEKLNRLNFIEKKIIELKAKYGDKHPDVVRYSKEAALLKEQIGQEGTGGAKRPSSDEQSDNPGYMNIKAQIIVAESEINALKAERKKVTEKLEDYQNRLERAPFIDEEYNKLTLDYQNARIKFNEASNKLHNARIAQEMNASGQGARFHIDSPAFLPDSPYKPNRPIIILLGFLLAMGTAVGLTALKETMDTSIKATEEIESILDVPVLATVSYYDTPEQQRLRRKKRLVLASWILGIILFGSFLVDRFVVPLDHIWTTVENRLVEMGIPIKQESKSL
ncbi:Wzz/FepE/Etk N-terminal domain-containing protein [uncultured Desulfosarcina sp.]|uniref:Wzz/FepE/Etk N-terminal domain-containing protein n=1 Tax=uncultured Desulfosarcina sp. TaxID=218289 RepID=UPI0029C97E00|nr:Wzz/FepE/Etk N-terminal domain-containing protein [uncultured Desulfosarcina sp.]